MDTVEQKIRKILVSDFGREESEVVMESTLAGDLNMDSIELVDLAMHIEEAFDIEVPDSEVTADMTVEQVCEKVKRLAGVY
jgi:acyl carrier protein